MAVSNIGSGVSTIPVGSLSRQASNNVSITGGSINGLTEVGIGIADAEYALDVSKNVSSSDFILSRFSNTGGGTQIFVGRASNVRVACHNLNNEYWVGLLRNAGSPSGRYYISTNYDVSAGGNEFSVGSGAGVLVGNPTGGDKGFGTLNATAVYDDNVLLTDFVFEKYFDGVPKDAEHSNYRMKSLDEEIRFTEENKHLSTITGRKEFEENGKPSTGKLISQLWETVETQFLYIKELKERIENLEGKTV